MIWIYCKTQHDVVAADSLIRRPAHQANHHIVIRCAKKWRDVDGNEIFKSYVSQDGKGNKTICTSIGIKLQECVEAGLFEVDMASLERIRPVVIGRAILQQVLEIKEVTAKSSLEVGDLDRFASDGGGASVAIGLEVVGGLSSFVLERC